MSQDSKIDRITHTDRPRRRRRYSGFVSEPGLPAPVVRLETEQDRLNRIQEIIDSDTELTPEI